MWTHGETITVHRHTPGPQDAHGNATSFYVDEPMDNVAVAPRQDEEQRNNRDIAIVPLTIYLPPGERLEAADEVTVRGRRYKVVGGRQEPWVSPFTGVEHGTQVVLERVEG